MELTIEQTLQQAIAAHKEGKLQEAERLYRTILQSQPAHPDVNHNLGLIAVSVNKAEAALPLFKTALETNPKIEQFWLSYIDALIKEKQFENAKLVIEQAKTQGVAEEKLNVLETQLTPTAQVNEPKLPEQKKRKKATKQNLKANNPSHEQLNSLLEYYQNGQISDAEKLAVSITQEFPKHQFGWKVLGAVLKQTGRIAESLTPMEKSTQLSPQDAEAHSNLGATLKELGRLDEAVASYKQAIALQPDYAEALSNLGNMLQELGKLDESLASCSQAIALKPDLAEAHNNLGITLKELGRSEEAIASYKQAIALQPGYAEAHSNLGNMLQELGRLEEAEASYTRAIALKPNFANAHCNLGITLQKLGKSDEAEASYTRAIALKPDYAKAHGNLGNTLHELGRLDEAEASYKKAIALKPDFARAHYNLGSAHQELGRLEEAEASYTRAITLKPNFAQAHCNLGITLQKLGKSDKAISAYVQAITFQPDFREAYFNLSLAIKSVRFNYSDPQLYPILLNILTIENITRPMDVVGSILSLLKHDPFIKDLLPEKNIATSLKEANSTIEALDKFTLLHRLMRLCPLPDLQFERLFVAMRSFLLTNLDKIEASPKLIYFLSTLSIHCFTNEHVYVERDEETQLVDKLKAEITQTIAQSGQPEAIKILCLATYRPLHQYDWCQQLEALDHLEEVKKRLIEEPLAEKVIAKDIPVLGEISDDVSLKVKEQYEGNPYPQWVKPLIPIKAKSISEICAAVNLHLHSETIKNVIAPAILIAGCGTGQHSIGTASRFSSCQVTAVDLSLASLAYAQRKTTELGITNLEYLQADILKLDQLDQEFDIIESAGVLHHMDKPMAGWKVLTDLLKPGGLMKIGLYSELARHHIVEVRKEITVRKVGTSEADIRKFRRALAESHDENHQLLTTSPDFFTLSTLRDLIFHVQEHRFTLPQIKNCLDQLGLKFCGFEVQDAISNFRKLHGKEADIYDLALWHEYEESNPKAFAGMYQFWCQKL